MKKPFPIKILVVEDCASDVHLLEHMLASAGGNVAITSTGRLIDAFQYIDSETFDVILLDLNLLDIDGVASVAALAAEAPMTPIIVYSGMENRNLIEEALLCGAKHYLIKGREDGHSLRRTIDSVLSRYAPSALTLVDRRVAL
jgi:DNA-binding NarL/FixJ family response regulator